MRFCFAVIAVVLATKASDVKLLDELKAKDDIKELSDGLLYKVIERGDGKKHPKVDTQCSVHYEGKLLADHVAGSDKVFDSSYKRGEPTKFPPNQVIKGWTMMLQKMVAGDKVEVYLPAELAYGKNGAGGSIPGDTALMFTIELKKIHGKTVNKKDGDEL